MNISNCLTIFLCVVPITAIEIPLFLTIDQIVPRPRRTLTKDTVEFNHERFVLLGCNISQNALSLGLKLSWQFKVTEGSVKVDNVNFNQIHDQLAVSIAFPGKEPKGKVNLTCTATYPASQIIYYQTYLSVNNSSEALHSSWLVLLIAAALMWHSVVGE